MKFFETDDGERVVTQTPNKSISWAIVTMIGAALAPGSLGIALQYVSIGFYAYWALSEIVTGVNYFRKLLGLIVLGFAIAWVLTSLILD